MRLYGPYTVRIRSVWRLDELGDAIDDGRAHIALLGGLGCLYGRKEIKFQGSSYVGYRVFLEEGIVDHGLLSIITRVLE